MPDDGMRSGVGRLTPPRGGVSELIPLAVALGDLKRIRDESSPDSLASRAFRRAWAQLIEGQSPGDVALAITVDAVAATRLGGIDAGVLQQVGVGPDAAAHVLMRAFDEAGMGLAPQLRAALLVQLGRGTAGGTEIPHFAECLLRQPRAGATAPGLPRIILEPPENHGDHCLVVAVLGVALSGVYGADPAAVFLAGLAHHLHNATLPDSGFAGEVLLGDELLPLIRRLFERELASLGEHPIIAPLRAALAVIGDADTPEGRAFNAADVIDRVLQMRHYDRVAAFTIHQALDDLDLVHAGPLQAFHQDVLRKAGLP